MTIDMNQFFQVFFDEAEELLAEMEKLLLAVDIDSPDNEQLHAIFRTAHSVKGGASTFGLTDISDVTHVLESLLDKIRNGDMALTRGHVDAFLSAKDVLKMQLDGHRNGSIVDRNAVADIRMLLQSLLPDSRTLKSTAAVHTPVDRKTTEARRTTFRVRLPLMPEHDLSALIAELGLLGHAEHTMLEDGRHLISVQTEAGSEDILSICSFVLDVAEIKIDQELAFSGQDSSVAAAVREQEENQGYGFFEPLESVSAFPANSLSSSDKDQSFAGITDLYPEGQPHSLPGGGTSASGGSSKNHPARREADKNQAAHESSSIRVGIEKVDLLINLVGELVITQAMIEQRTGTLDPLLYEKLLSSVNQLTRNTRALQESVMSIRMMPMDYAFSRFPRMVRDLATKLGKQVEFVTRGAATELDKGLIERIVDPLTHLVRNSIDHGIETPDVRIASGKPSTGKLLLSAAHQGGNIVIEVADDGAGLNRDRILAKAREKGFSTSDSMPDADVWQLIFAPGFSTAEQVTDVSGRGVGMDVVKRNINSMGGSIDIRSGKGYGTTMSISLPLTLAILDGMSVRVGNEIYILPLSYVVESLQPSTKEIKEISGHGSVVKIRGTYLPVLRLHRIFDIVPTFSDPSQGVLVILESDGRRLALLVDELVGQQQVVVKNLESNYRRVAGISGATILGDGGVSLIIDVAALIQMSRKMQAEAEVVQ